jgi:hypothetical protein
LSISVPHCAHVQPPHIAWRVLAGLRMTGTAEAHVGHFVAEASRLMPHRLLRAVAKTKKSATPSGKNAIANIPMSQKTTRAPHVLFVSADSI